MSGPRGRRRAPGLRARIARLLPGRPSARLPARRPALVGAAVAIALVAGAVTPGIVPVAAAWTDREWAKGRIGTESVDCGTSTGFTTTASSRFLRGSLLGLDLDTVAGLSGLTAVDDARPGSQATPSTALNPAPGVHSNPLAVTAVGGAAALDLTGLNANLPGGYLGGLTQYTRVTETGTSTAATGLVTDQGGVGVTGTNSGQLPGRATLSLNRVLPLTADATAATLAVGAVSSRSSLDWCTARRSAVWGTGSVDGVTRDYGIAGLELRVASPPVAAVTTAVNATTGTALPAAANLLGGSQGSIAGALLATVGTITKSLNLGGLTTTSPRTSPVIVTGLEAAAADVAPLLTKPLRSADGTVAIDLTTGRVTVDLAALLGTGANGVNGLAPNTELVLDATVLNAVAARAGALIDARNAEIRAAMTAALQKVTVSIDATTRVSAAGLSILDLRMQYEGTAAQLAAGSPPFTVTTNLLGTASALNLALAALGLGTVTSLVTSLNGLATTLVGTVSQTVSTGLAAPVTSLGTTLTGISGRLVTSLAAILNPLPSVLSLRVNVQPDKPNAPPGTTPVPALPPDTSAAYTVTALRIGLVDALDPQAGFAVVDLATSTAGRNTYRAR